MSDVVVDASVALKWVLRETDSDRATMLLDKWINESKQMIAPPLFTYEVTNIIYRQIGKGQFTFDEATLGLKKLFSIGVSLVFSDSQEISLQAMRIAHQFHLPASYDSHYLALAEQQNCEYWTADTRLWNTVKGRLSWIRWLGDYHP